MRISIPPVNNSNQSIINIKTRFENLLTYYINSTDFYKNYRLSKESLAELKYVVDECKKNKIDLIVFISPLHVSHLEAIRLAGLWSVFEEWKIEVSEIVKSWDFGDYHTIATEAITEDMVYFTDSIHYTPLTGNLMLDTMLSKTPNPKYSNFGILIDSNNVQEQLLRVRDNRKNWVDNNLKLYHWVEKLFFQMSID